MCQVKFALCYQSITKTYMPTPSAPDIAPLEGLDIRPVKRAKVVEARSVEMSTTKPSFFVEIPLDIMFEVKSTISALAVFDYFLP